MAGSASITGRQHYILGIGHPVAEPIGETPPGVVQSSVFPNAGVIVLESAPPNNADGRPDGTIYIQTGA